MNLFELIQADHREVNIILAKAVETGPVHTEKRARLLEEACRIIQAHLRCEEKAVYDDLKEKAETHEAVLKVFEDHQALGVLVEKMLILPPGEGLARLPGLRESWERHVDEEENALFDPMRRIYGPDPLEKMADDFKKIKAELTRLRQFSTL